jgi:hypothetical protein
MRKTLYICDRCGLEFPLVDIYEWPVGWACLSWNEVSGGFLVKRSLSLCAPCSALVVHFARTSEANA